MKVDSINKRKHKNMKRITKKAWFSKRILGWGYRPISLEGWLITVVFVITSIANLVYNHRSTKGYAILVVFMVIFFIIAYLTSEAPGSMALDKLRSKNKEN